MILKKKHITIGIDGNEANALKRVGVHMYALQTLWGIYKSVAKTNQSIVVIVFLKSIVQKDMPPENSFWKYKILRGDRLWILKRLTPHLLLREKLDVFFAPSHYLPPIARCPMVCAITDLGYLENSEQFTRYDYWQLKHWSAMSLLVADKIIAISKSTADDIVRHYSFTRKKVNIIYLGHDSSQFNERIDNNIVRQVNNKYLISGEYLLYIGTLKPSKNIEGLIHAFHIVKNKGYRIKLVIAGKKGWMYESIFTLVTSLKLQKDIIFTDYLPEEDKAPLLKGAKAFVMASFWEGFGIDVVSAMACGIPAIISDVGSLPEVGGKAAIYVDPYSPESISKGIINLLSKSSREYREISKNSIKQASVFSWDKTGHETLDLLINVVKNKESA
jgi:glycosyltransferase involved in cell wall biosynthesis